MTEQQENVNNTNDAPVDEQKHMRKIRSFVKREGRMTHRQQTATDTLWATMGIDFNKELLDFKDVFGRNADVVLEIGFGMGKSLVEMALNAPEKDFLGIEVHGPGVGACLADAADAGLTNLRVMNYDAVEVLEFMIPDNSLATFQLYFPDPWHKARHNKRRLVQTSFIEDMCPKLVFGGKIHMATDWEQYAEHMLEVMSSSAGFENCSQDNYIERPEWRPLTKFESRGHRLGHGVWDLLFKRIS